MIFLLACLVLMPSSGFSQINRSYPVTLDVTNPPPSCGIRGTTDLLFGTVEVPVSGSINVTVPVPTGTTAFSTGHQAGSFSLRVSDVNDSRITIGWPSEIASGSRQIPFSSATFDQSDDQRTYTPASGVSTRGGGFYYRGPAPGLFDSATRYYRVGGTISNISLSTPWTTYSGEISIQVVCS